MKPARGLTLVGACRLQVPQGPGASSPVVSVDRLRSEDPPAAVQPALPAGGLRPDGADDAAEARRRALPPLPRHPMGQRRTSLAS